MHIEELELVFLIHNSYLSLTSSSSLFSESCQSEQDACCDYNWDKGIEITLIFYVFYETTHIKSYWMVEQDALILPVVKLSFSLMPIILWSNIN